MDNLRLGTNIRNTRKARELSSDKLSELCNVTPSYMRQIEAGNKTPSLPLFVRLCEVLHVSPASLMNGVVKEMADDDIKELKELMQIASPEQLRILTAALKACCESLNKKTKN